MAPLNPSFSFRYFKIKRIRKVDVKEKTRLRTHTLPHANKQTIEGVLFTVLLFEFETFVRAEKVNKRSISMCIDTVNS